MMMMMILVVVILILAFILLRIGYTLYIMNCCSDKTTYVQRSIKSLVVLGSGGHTGEMLKIIRALDTHRYSPRVYVVAATDSVSLRRLQDMEKEFKVCGHLQYVCLWNYWNYNMES